MKPYWAALAVLLLSVGLVQRSPANPPRGFTTMGTALPEDWGPLSHVPKLIKERGLQEIVPPEWQTREKWGTSVTPQDEARGYVVFSRHYLDPVYSYSLPNNRTDSLAVFAGLSEYEPVSFSLYPLRDTKGIKVSVSDLVNEKGSILKSENVDVRVVRSIPFERGEKGYALEPTLLEKQTSLNLLKGRVAQVWLTLYIPATAASGRYAGKVRLEGGANQPCELTLAVRVLPLKLQEPDTLYGMCFLIPGRSNLHPENLNKYYADMREHNMNSQWTWPDAGISNEKGKVVFDFTKFGLCRKKEGYYGNSLDEMMAGYVSAGFSRPWVCGTLDSVRDVIIENLGFHPFTQEFDKAYLDYVRQLLSHSKEKGWPAFSLHPCDEPSHGGYDSMQYAMYYYRLLKESFPSVRTFADGVFSDGGKWGKEDRVLFSYLDIMCYQSQSRADVEFSKQAGLEFWIYNQCGFGKLPKLNRDRWGFYAWKVGCRGCFHWVYTWWLDPGLPSWSFPYVVTTSDGPLPTLAWEAVREGIDDAKYAHTLAKLIERAASSGNSRAISASEEARRYLDTTLSAIPTYLPESKAEEADRGRYFGNTTSRTHDLVRWGLAQRILGLQALLSGQAKPGPLGLQPLEDDAHTLGLWHFDEGKGTAVSDDHHANPAHDNAGTFAKVEGKGNPFWTQGACGGALQFAPYTAPVVIPLTSRPNPEQLTCEMYVSYQEIAPEGSYLAAQGDRWCLRLTSERSLSFRLNRNGWKEIAAGYLFPNRWYHVAATYDGEFMREYVDGELVDFLACKGPMGGTGEQLFFGGTADGQSGLLFGRIDEVRISDVARTVALPWGGPRGA